METFENQTSRVLYPLVGWNLISQSVRDIIQLFDFVIHSARDLRRICVSVTSTVHSPLLRVDREFFCCREWGGAWGRRSYCACAVTMATECRWRRDRWWRQSTPSIRSCWLWVCPGVPPRDICN